MVLCRTPDVMSKDNWLHKDNGYPTNQRTMSRGRRLLQILRLQLPRAPDIEFPSIGLGSSSCINFVCVHHRLAILLRIHSTQYISRPKWLHSERVHEFLLVILNWLQMHACLEISDGFGHSRDNLVTWRTLNSWVRNLSLLAHATLNL